MPLSVMNWQIEFEFKVDGSAHNIYGDGFALWISKDRAKVGPVFGSVGKSPGVERLVRVRHSIESGADEQTISLDWASSSIRELSADPILRDGKSAS
jgi:hypothetical protein